MNKLGCLGQSCSLIRHKRSPWSLMLCVCVCVCPSFISLHYFLVLSNCIHICIITHPPTTHITHASISPATSSSKQQVRLARRLNTIGADPFVIHTSLWFLLGERLLSVSMDNHNRNVGPPVTQHLNAHYSVWAMIFLSAVHPALKCQSRVWLLAHLTATCISFCLFFFFLLFSRAIQVFLRALCDHFNVSNGIY